MSDFEEKEKIEPDLVHNARMILMGELLAGIAHEMKNPLSFVHANMGNLSKFSSRLISLIESYDRLDLPEEAKAEIKKLKADINFDYIAKRMTEMIERSREGIERTSKIVMGLNSLSRRETDRMEEADINSAISTTLDLLFHEYKNRIELKKEFGELPPVKCNIGKLNQVFMNLIVNACHAIEDKGEIRIVTTSDKGNVQVRISDTGSGIPGNVIENIFDPFFTTKPDGKGTGIGLSISSEIIKEHSGEISVESAEGEGTTFTLTIPVNNSTGIGKDTI